MAGLATAIRMASRGHEVEVFEANDYAGGKLSQFSIGDYRFDAGPSLFTMPEYIEELFQVAGEPVEQHFSYQRLPVVCKYFWEDGTQLEAKAEAEAFAREVEQQLQVPARRVLNFLHESARKYELTGRIFLEKSLHRWQTWLSPKVAKALFALPALDLFSSMNRVHERKLGNPKLVQLFNRFATYNGSNPYKAPGLLSMIPYFEHEIGAYYPDGGMYSITQALQSLAEKKGARIHFNTRVDEIGVTGKRASHLLIHGERHDFDRIVSNMDIFFTYRKLLPRHKAPERILAQEKSTSALIFYWGIDRKFPELDLHNILFSDNYREEFDLLEAGKLTDDPTVYVNISQRYTPNDAPEGAENWFTMVNVPYDAGQDWDHLIDRTRENVIRKVSRMLGQDIRQHIACEEILDPRSIESKTASHLGALYGTSSNDRNAAFMRHPNFSRSIADLYFCGGSVHPGGGIPLCLLSARIIDELLHEPELVSA